MESLDRLFGKELSNFMDHGVLNRQRNKNSIILGQKMRGVSIDEAKVNPTKIIKEQNHQNISHRIEQVNKEPEMRKQDSVQGLSDYFDDCLAFMRSQQEKTFADGPAWNYMAQQNQINANMRGILLDWIVDIHFKFKMFPQTLYIVVAIIDKYLSLKNIPKEKLQLVGTAAFFIAAKYEETYQVPVLSELIKLSANAFSKHELLKTEADIMKVLDFNLIFNTTYKFLEPFAKVVKLDQKRFFLTQYVLELALSDMKFLKFKPSLLAASAVYLINKIRKVSEVWSNQIIKLSGYEQKDLRSAAKQLCHLLQNTESLANTKCLKRKFGLPKFHEVSKIRLQRKDKH